MPGIRLIACLGNPGREHERDRHNAGFWLAQRYADKVGLRWTKESRFKGLTAKAGAPGAEVLLLLPQTYMNRSGQSVVALARFFKIEPGEVLVVHDELDFPPGIARLKLGGGVAGHNGLKDIAAQFGVTDFWRLRVGIGHPGDRDMVSDWVLSSPSPDDRKQIEAAIEGCIEVMPAILAGDLQGATQKLHGALKQKSAAAAGDTPSGTAGSVAASATSPSGAAAGGPPPAAPKDQSGPAPKDQNGAAPADLGGARGEGNNS